MVTEDMGTRRRYVSGEGLDDLLVTGEAGRYSEHHVAEIPSNRRGRQPFEALENEEEA
jgi:hypothetical protein